MVAGSTSEIEIIENHRFSFLVYGASTVGGEERHARARLQAQLHEYLLHPPDQFGGALVGDRSSRPAERCARGIARQRPQRLPADGRKGIERIGHVSSRRFCHLLCLGPSVVPMLLNASTMNPRRRTVYLGVQQDIGFLVPPIHSRDFPTAS